MAAFARTRMHFRMRVLAQNPAVWRRLFKHRQHVGQARVQEVLQDPTIALQPQVVDARTFPAIPPQQAGISDRAGLLCCSSITRWQPPPLTQYREFEVKSPPPPSSCPFPGVPLPANHGAREVAVHDPRALEVHLPFLAK